MEKINRIKESIVQKHRDNIRKENEATSVEERFGGMIAFMQYFLYPVLVIWTGTTAALFMYTSMSKASTSIFFGAFCAIMLSSVIEGIKYYTGRKIIHFFSQGWFKEGIHNVFLSIPILILGLAAFGGSVYLAVQGSPLLSSNIIQSNGIQLVSVDSINAYYDNRVKAEQDKQNAAHKTTWKGSITTDAVRLSKSIQQTIDRIEKQRSAALETANKENETRKTDTKEFSNVWGSWLSGFGGWSELLQVVILIFLCLYSKYVYIENMQENEEQSQVLGYRSNHSNSVINNKMPVNEYDNARTVIRGFSPASEKEQTFVITKNEAVNDRFITETKYDTQSMIKLKIQRIQKYLAKWRSNRGGASETIIKNLRQDWKDIDELANKEEISAALYNMLFELRSKTESVLRTSRPRKIR